MVGDSHFGMNGRIQTDGKISGMGLHGAIDSSRCSVGFGEEAVIDNVTRTSGLWE